MKKSVSGQLKAIFLCYASFSNKFVRDKIRNLNLRAAIYILFIFLAGALLSCKKDVGGIFSKKDKLTQNKWQIKTIINGSSNTVLNKGNLQYKFEEDGEYLIYTVEGKSYSSTWELVENGQYLRIGGNTFKIKIISDRLLGLRYGDLEFFYVPVD